MDRFQGHPILSQLMGATARYQPTRSGSQFPQMGNRSAYMDRLNQHRATYNNPGQQLGQLPAFLRERGLGSIADIFEYYQQQQQNWTPPSPEPRPMPQRPQAGMNFGGFGRRFY